MTPWSAGGSGPARNACDRSTTLQRFPEDAPDFPGARNGPWGPRRVVSGSWWGSCWGTVAAVPADGRSPAFHHHGGQLFGHGFAVHVLRTRGSLLSRRQVPENRWTQAIEVDPGGHMNRSGTGHHRTTQRQWWSYPRQGRVGDERGYRPARGLSRGCVRSPAKGDGGCVPTSRLTAQSGPGENE